MTSQDSRVDAPFRVESVHRLRFTRRSFLEGNPTLGGLLRHGRGAALRVVVFLDESVSRAWPQLTGDIESFAQAHDWVDLPQRIHLVPGGEICKNEPDILGAILQAIHDAKIDRQAYVLAIGGGAVLDAVGYGAAITHRGVRLVRLPTTTLSQADSGVGVKNGVNAFGKKNYLGTFSPPWAVVNDEALLTTLSDRDWRCGFAEAVKVGLMKDAALFHNVCEAAAGIRKRDESSALPIVRRSAELHLRHITGGGDPFERNLARPLDFGHWAAHKLEQMSNFRLRHGESVAIGLALDSVYSAAVGLMDPDQVEIILRCLTDLGFDLYHEAMADTETLLEGLDEFREHLGGPLTIPLLKGFGKPVNVHEIDPAQVRSSIDRLAQQCAPSSVS